MKQNKILEKMKTVEKSKSWGGVRNGSGRKPRLQYESRELFNNAIDDEWENILEVLHSYIQKGDKEIIKWVVEQRIGKAPQSMDVTSKSISMNVITQDNESSGAIEVMEIARRVSAELKIIKTQ